jgi:hypothetical protein
MITFPSDPESATRLRPPPSINRGDEERFEHFRDRLVRTGRVEIAVLTVSSVEVLGFEGAGWSLMNSLR